MTILMDGMVWLIMINVLLHAVVMRENFVVVLGVIEYFKLKVYITRIFFLNIYSQVCLLARSFLFFLDRNTNLKLNGEYMGCHNETLSLRDIGSYNFSSSSMTIETCINICHSNGNLYAGLQLG